MRTPKNARTTTQHRAWRPVRTHNLWRTLGAIAPERPGPALLRAEAGQTVIRSGGSVGSVAVPSRRHPEGSDGDWFIDDRCIGCGASTSIAPGLIRERAMGVNTSSSANPLSQEDVVLAQQAAEVCPTRSIGKVSGKRWPTHHPVEVASGIWRTGSNSAETAGGNAFVVQRSSGGVLIDAPRLHPDCSLGCRAAGRYRGHPAHPSR